MIRWMPVAVASTLVITAGAAPPESGSASDGNPVHVGQRYIFYGNEFDHARCPYLTKLSDDRLLIGMNIVHNSVLMTDADWRQKPHFLLGRTPEELARKRPTLLTGQHGHPPYFFELKNGDL